MDPVITRTAIKEFLTTLGVSTPIHVHDAELRSRVKNITSRWDNEATLCPYIIAGITLAETAYSHVRNFETKVTIAVFNALIISMDEPHIYESMGAEDFPRRLCQLSANDTSGHLRTLKGLLDDMWDQFLPYTACAIMADTLRYVNGTFLEMNARSDAMNLRSRLFVEYQRDLASMPETFVLFIWEKDRFPDVTIYVQAIPEAMTFFKYTNDVLSFYKEELNGDVDNYIHGRAHVSEKSVPDTLQDVAYEAVAAAQRVREILGKGAARDAWEQFVQGFVNFHTCSPRYRLREILDGE
ncbi:uncharacterized protein FIBRA_00549 [Fibroporia radiculosa]|uniref:Terpene synthase n=1 Tax=Fibroporia radiculosa TaxID=599839 RepID=J4H076_9APHY|nr:uncharacterized protein FIBRA_00549 [Fibroporia radiculosa]CCL98549.1 predicted protein [Fibroporia radiculosa]